MTRVPRSRLLRLTVTLLQIAFSFSQDCSSQPDGYGPEVRPDTIENFKSYAAFQEAAQSAPTPPGYRQTFRDLDASVSAQYYSAQTYFGVHYLRSYDTNQCANLCSGIRGCTGFNTYVERDPSVLPAAACPNPPSITKYGCTSWGAPINASTATDTGQYQEQFQVIVVASNGYELSTTSSVESTSIATSSVKPTAGSGNSAASTLATTASASAAAESTTSKPLASASGSTSTGGGLSTSAKAGIGVGVGLVFVIIIALLGVMVIRRRRKRSVPLAAQAFEKDATGSSPQAPQSSLADEGAIWMAGKPVELPYSPQLHELPTGEKTSGRSELQGSAVNL